MKPPDLTFYGRRGHTTTKFPSPFWTWIKHILEFNSRKSRPHLTYWAGPNRRINLKERKFIFFWPRFYCCRRRLKVPLKGHVLKSVRVMRVQSCACCFAYKINCSCFLRSRWRHRPVWLSSLLIDLPLRSHSWSQHAADSPPDIKFSVILRLFGLIFLVQIKYKS